MPLLLQQRPQDVDLQLQLTDLALRSDQAPVTLRRRPRLQPLTASLEELLPPAGDPSGRLPVSRASRSSDSPRSNLSTAVAVLAQISVGIGIVLAGGDGRVHEILAGAHEAGAGLVWGLLVALATLARPGERRVLKPRAWRAATAVPVARPET